MKTKRWISSLLLLALLALLVGVYPASAATVFSLTLEAPADNPEVGTQFTVDINADATAQIRGIQFDLQYDPAVLRLDSVALNPNFWKSPGNVMTCFDSSGPIDITIEFAIPGTINHVTGLLDGLGTAPIGVPGGYGCTGSGRIATLTFTVLAKGRSTNQFQEVLIPDSSDAALPPAAAGVDGYEALADSILIPFKVFLPLANQN